MSEQNWFEREKRIRNATAGFKVQKGLKFGYCNRGACQKPLQDGRQAWMKDHETMSDAKLWYCLECAAEFDKSDDQFKIPRRINYEMETLK